MFNYGNGIQSPYINSQMYQQPKQEVVKVNGENGARAYPMGANSSALLLDESGMLVWLVMTDGAGYKTIAPYDIKPHQSPTTPNYNDLETRIARLEEFINGFTTNTTATQQSNTDSKSDAPTERKPDTKFDKRY